MHTCPIKPLGECFVFQFTDDAAEGSFITNTRSGFIMTNQNKFDNGQARWGKVCRVGKDVTMFTEGQYVLIEPLMWTIAMTVDDVKYWKSEQLKVMAVTDDIEMTYLL